MTFIKENYVGWWKQFSQYIRTERANGRCEKCGIENKTVNGRGSVVVLTVAHLDNAGGVCRCKKQYGFKCAKPSHVLALCQACHLSLDRAQHIAVRRKNLVRKKDGSRGLFEVL